MISYLDKLGLTLTVLQQFHKMYSNWKYSTLSLKYKYHPLTIASSFSDIPKAEPVQKEVYIERNKDEVKNVIIILTCEGCDTNNLHETAQS